MSLPLGEWQWTLLSWGGPSELGRTGGVSGPLPPGLNPPTPAHYPPTPAHFFSSLPPPPFLSPPFFQVTPPKIQIFFLPPPTYLSPAPSPFSSKAPLTPLPTVLPHFWWKVNTGSGNGLMHQATSHCLSQGWSRSMSPYGITSSH